MRGLIALALLAASCNSLLGIDATVGDNDGDGVLDAVDNCPNDPNPDQFDSNHDGVGDACSKCLAPINKDLDGDGYDDRCDMCIGPGFMNADVDGDLIDDGCDPCIGNFIGTTGVDVSPADGVDDGCTICRTPSHTDLDNDGFDDACDQCLGGPPHDEDHDSVDDGCDNCPILANTGQELDAMDDNDRLGAACDPDELIRHERPLFDPFIWPHPEIWGDQPGWVIRDDALHLDAEPAVLTRDTVIPAKLTFRFSAILARSPTGAGSRGGLRVTSASPADVVTCELDASGTLIMNENGTKQTMAAVNPASPVRLELARLENGIAGPQRSCATYVAGAMTAQLTGSAGAADYIVGLVGTGTLAFESVELLQAVP